MKTVKKLCSLSLALLCALTITATAADSLSTTDYDGLITASSADDFVIKNSVLTAYEGNGGAVTIPDGVTAIGEQAFVYMGHITSISIPSSVTSIGDMAFFKCSAMTSINIPSSVTSMGRMVFFGCDSLTSLSYPGHEVDVSNDTIIIDNFLCYYHGSAVNYTVSDGVTGLGYSAFSSASNLKTVTIPLSVTEIEEGTFDYCYALTDIYYDGTEESWNALKSGNYLWNLPSPTVHFANKTATPAGIAATASPASYLVNGEEQAVAAYLIEGNNYIKIRDLASLVNGTEKNFEVTWNNDAKCIEILEATAYTPVGGELVTDVSANESATLNLSYPVYFNGETVDLTSYMIGDNTYFKLRDVMALVDIYVGWDNDTKTVTLDTSASYED